ncbi:hypothetical protein VQ02_06720 [Methylobacterium variabile]|jgi:DNA-binding IclR family transcriptional regulator|uniref:IclR family transcriptional regulator n=1 Tax=Methylobacterium variabile TaxID=298794 RepID=A0A0J6T577_9HYPH|nr:IclR family transcriptional regulator [Methylobacterium variabile]KMO40972.1 hypothetical protein VQ02_06720 [Methylobacterium variabile]
MTSDADDSPLGRSFRILELLAASPEGLSLTEIATGSGLVVATAHRQLGTLLGLGLVRKVNARSFGLGERVWRLAHLMSGGADVVTVAEPVLKALVERFGETAFLAKLAGDQVELIATSHPDDFGKAYAQPGRGMPLHAAASGKILLSLQDDAFIDAYLKLPREAFTAATKIEERMIRADIAEARERRIAVCNNEFDPGILSYAAPVQDARTGLAYAVAIFGLAERFAQVDRATVEDALTEAARTLAQALRGAR